MFIDGFSLFVAKRRAGRLTARRRRKPAEVRKG